MKILFWMLFAVLLTTEIVTIGWLATKVHPAFELLVFLTWGINIPIVFKIMDE